MLRHAQHRSGYALRSAEIECRIDAERSSLELHARTGHGFGTELARGSERAGRHASLRRLRGPAVLRFATGEDHSMGRGSRRDTGKADRDASQHALDGKTDRQLEKFGKPRDRCSPVLHHIAGTTTCPNVWQSAVSD